MPSSLSLTFCYFFPAASNFARYLSGSLVIADSQPAQQRKTVLPFTVTFTGLPAGGWFGEGTAIKKEPYRYNVQALRASVVAGLPVAGFHWLLDHSIGFNRFVMNQLNERLGQFIAAREIDRINNPDVRVARSLASLFNPVLYPGVGEVLRITQQELAYLVGLSRQRVNVALQALEAAGAIRIEYGGLRVLNLDALRQSR